MTSIRQTPDGRSRHIYWTYCTLGGFEKRSWKRRRAYNRLNYSREKTPSVPPPPSPWIGPRKVRGRDPESEGKTSWSPSVPSGSHWSRSRLVSDYHWFTGR